MNPVIEEILRTGVVRDEQGSEYELHSNLGRVEGSFLSQVIRDNPHIRKTLEVGCAYGLSSLYICSALSGREGAEHVIVDPYQTRDWHGVGLSNLRRAGFGFFKAIEKPSEFALPEIAMEGAGTFDFVFVDGWHTFDHTLIDLFYSNLLLKVGGYLLVDDCSFAQVSRAISYFKAYPAYRLAAQAPFKRSLKRTVGRIVRFLIPPLVAGWILPKNLYERFYARTLYSRVVALKKVEEDRRSWDWFTSF